MIQRKQTSNSTGTPLNQHTKNYIESLNFAYRRFREVIQPLEEMLKEERHNQWKIYLESIERINKAFSEQFEQTKEERKT